MAYQSKHWVILPAAGIGARMQASRPKQYLTIHGQSVLEHTLECFTQDERFEGIFVGVSSEDTFWPEIAKRFCATAKVGSYVGGTERSETVLNGLGHMKAQASRDDWIWVHDAARPCLEARDLNALFAALEAPGCPGVLLASPVADTIKRSDGGRVVTATVDRSNLWRALTPQVFRYGDLLDALVSAVENGCGVTDESAAMEAHGVQPELVIATGNNLKLTHPNDLELAMHLISSSDQRFPRIGNGYDVHAFEPGDHVMLGGVRIPHTQGLRAHSDGDVLLHALMDAMLGALALGDIGKYFPDTQAQWKGADSRALLAAVKTLVEEANYDIANIDVTVICEQPKLSRHIDAIRLCIAEDLSIDVAQVSIKATTTEKLGFTGRGEGIASQAAVLLIPA